MEDIKKKNQLAIMIIACLFFIFGFVTWINGALIPFMKTVNELTEGQSYLVASASYISFVIMALPALWILTKVGYQKGMSLGLNIMALGALLFIPAAEARTFWLFLLAIFTQGAGMAILQTAANPYITILGPIESGAKRIAIMGIANKIAGALGSLIFGAILLSGIDEVKTKLSSVSIQERHDLLDATAKSVFIPYLLMAMVLFILGILIRRAPLPHVEASESQDDKIIVSEKTSIFQFPHLWIGILALFVYVGAEVIAGDTIIAYGISLGFTGNEAKYFTTYTLMAMVATYAIGVITIPKYMSQKTALIISACLGITFSIFIINTSGFISVLCVAALGVANALVWPAIWPLSLDGLGKFTKTASALLIMSISGGAIIPPLYGRLVDSERQVLISLGHEQMQATGMAATSSYWLLIPCYTIILFFALKGHKLGKKSYVSKLKVL